MKKLTALLMSVCLMLTLSVPAFASGKGDVNNDGYVDTSDVRRLLSMVVNGTTPSATEMYWGDYNINGEIDTSDARVLLDRLLTNADSEAINYAKPTGTDYWGEHAISLLGDSISFGIGASDPLPENSYVSYVKKAVMAANGGQMNYGFVNAYPSVWWTPQRHEIVAWPTRSKTNGVDDWVCDNNDDPTRLVTVGFTTYKRWATISYQLREQYADDYDYVCIYYHSEVGGGSFALADGNGGEVADVNGSKAYISTNNTTSETKRTAFYRLADCTNGEITICADTGANSDQPVTITGLGFYKELPSVHPEYITFNSFVRGGITLIDQSDIVLDQVCAADTLILALGFNDYMWDDNPNRVLAGEFAERVDYIIARCKENGTNVIVTDHTWNHPDYGQYEPQLSAHAEVEKQLKRLCEETNGIYIDQQTMIGSDTVVAELNNGVADKYHPNDTLMKWMAQNIVEAMGLEWTESWT